VGVVVPGLVVGYDDGDAEVFPLSFDREALPSLFAAHVAALDRRYADLCTAHGLDGVVVHSGTAQKKSAFDDQYWPLVVVPTFRHWLPLAVEGCALWIRPGSKPVLFLNVARSFWDGPPEVESDHFWSAFDVVEITSPAQIREALSRSVGRLEFVGEDVVFGGALGFADDRLAPDEFMRDLDGTRVLKTPYEVACHREANRRAAVGHIAVAHAFYDGTPSELDLHLLYLNATAQDDADAPYKGIVALDEHAATLHHVAYGRRRGEAKTLLTDAGAACMGYHSDITRTLLKVRGGAADVFAGLIAAINTLQQHLVTAIVPGQPYQALHDESHRLLASALVSVGVAKAGVSADALVISGVTRKLFPHGLGHSLGVATHDVGCKLVAPKSDNPFLRNTADIAVGQVFTIEPGCYFIPSLLQEARALPEGGGLDWSVVDALVPFGGIRIEDNIHVTAAGPDNLTRPSLPDEALRPRRS
jgi:Xaa-Pro dipeptidase